MLFSTAWRALQYHKVRTLLTMLGIIIGIAALITTMAIGHGAQKKIEAEIAAMGSNAMILHAGSPIKSKNATKNTYVSRMRLQDMISLKKQIPLIKYISPIVDSHKTTISHAATHIEVSLRGASEQYLHISNRKIKLGRNTSSDDDALARRVIVLGSEAADLLFKQADPIGKSVLIGKKNFLVIGVFEKIEAHDPMATPNLTCLIPYTTAQKKIYKESVEFPHYFFISCINQESIQTVVRQTTNIMRVRHHLKPNEPNDFTVFDQQSYGKAKARSSDILSILLLIIASISLLVGGIGVMNIMLVSVSERTKEIGVRMALGATTSMILTQFIIESIVICCLGGLIGICVGTATPLLIGTFAKWPIAITPISVVVASVITMLVGIFFGIYPAHQASQLRPVEALQEQ
jgi:putative ABC transport system permease protein